MMMMMMMNKKFIKILKFLRLLKMHENIEYLFEKKKKHEILLLCY